jgi:hypothetical protein
MVMNWKRRGKKVLQLNLRDYHGVCRDRLRKKKKTTKITGKDSRSVGEGLNPEKRCGRNVTNFLKKMLTAFKSEHEVKYTFSTRLISKIE